MRYGLRWLKDAFTIAEEAITACTGCVSRCWGAVASDAVLLAISVRSRNVL
jgi:hypothetical protein